MLQWSQQGRPGEGETWEINLTDAHRGSLGIWTLRKHLPFVHLLSIFCEKLHASPNTLEIPFPLVLVAANSSGLLQPEKYFVSDILTQ